MKTAIGIICLVAGVILIVWGYNLTQTVNAQFTRIFTGSPGDKTMWLYVAGAGLCALGGFQLFSAKK